MIPGEPNAERAEAEAKLTAARAEIARLHDTLGGARAEAARTNDALRAERMEAARTNDAVRAENARLSAALQSIGACLEDITEKSRVYKLASRFKGLRVAIDRIAEEVASALRRR